MTKYILILLLVLSNTVFAQSNKYALIIQNRNFTHWNSFGRLEENVSTLKRLLMNQGFEDRKIIEKKDLTADQFRKTFREFIGQLPIGAICVVFLGSHGYQISDINDDEEKHHDLDRKDEVLICTDSPKEWITSTKKYNLDYHPKAIIDDELGYFNDSLLNKIGNTGQYLLLADFCFSYNSEREDIKENKYFDGGLFLDHLNSEKSTNFIIISASSGNLKVSDSPKSFFMTAIEKGFKAFPISPPTYSELYNELKKTLNSISIVGNSNQLVFLGKWNTFSQRLYQEVKAKFIPKRDIEKQYTMKVENNIDDFQIGMFLELYLNKKQLSEGKLIDLDKTTNEITIECLNGFQPKEEQNYQLRISHRFQSALKTLFELENKNKIVGVLELLPVANFSIKTQMCVNEYSIVNKEKVPNQKICNSIENFDALDLNDKITFSFDNSGINKELYYTLLDINQEGVNPCFVDSSGEISGFININEPLTYRSRVTKPLGKSSILMILCDIPIAKEQMKSLIGKSLSPIQKNNVWNILTHVVGYQNTSYQVVVSRKK